MRAPVSHIVPDWGVSVWFFFCFFVFFATIFNIIHHLVWTIVFSRAQFPRTEAEQILNDTMLKMKQNGNGKELNK